MLILLRWVLPLLLSLMAFPARTQNYFLTLARGYTPQSNLSALYDSLLVPLLITDNKVYILRTECFPRAQGQDVNDRAAGFGANNRDADGTGNTRNNAGIGNDRSSDQDKNERHAAGTINDRDEAGNDNARKADGEGNNRNADQKANQRNGSGNTNNRQTGGAFTGIRCWVDAKGNLIISFEHMELDKKARLFLNGQYYTSKSKHFKLTQL